MATERKAPGVALLVVAVGLAVVGVFCHYAFTAEYGDISASGFGGGWGAFVQSPGPIALVLVVIAAIAAMVLSSQRWVRAVAVTVPVVMMLAVLAVTPAALEDKRGSQFTTTPQCLTGVQDASAGGGEDGKDEGGAWLTAAEDSQQAFDSIEHVGLFDGGDTVGAGGCSLGLTQAGDVDFMAHYRSALPQAGWQIVEDDGDRLRAEKESMAFEVRLCAEGGGVWAGRSTEVASGLCPEG